MHPGRPCDGLLTRRGGAGATPWTSRSRPIAILPDMKSAPWPREPTAERPGLPLLLPNGKMNARSATRKVDRYVGMRSPPTLREVAGLKQGDRVAVQDAQLPVLFRSRPSACAQGGPPGLVQIAPALITAEEMAKQIEVMPNRTR